MLKRVISLILSLVMILGMMPINITAAAEEIPAEDLSVAETTAPTEEETVPTEAEPEETVFEENIPEVTSVTGEVQTEYAVTYDAGITASGTCGANLIWVLDNEGTLTISGSGPMNNFSNNSPWNNYLDTIITAIIEDGVTSIGDYAFCDCDKLTSISIPNSVESIGEVTFGNCHSLISVTIPAGVNNIPFSAFTRCNSLTNITLPDSLKSIENYAFNSCSSLISITIPEGIRNIGVDAFENCTELREIYFSGSAPSFEKEIFRNVTATAYYPSNDSTWNCNVMLNYGGIITWESYEKENYLAKGTCGGNLTWKLSEDRILTISGSGPMDNFTASTRPWKSYASSISSVYIESGVTSIGDYAFYDCKNMSVLSLQDGMVSIGNNSFYCCEELISVIIPYGVVSIGYGAFERCNSLTYLEIPNSVTNIGSSAFADCDRLTSVEIPNSVTSIGDDVFCSCDRLTSVIIPNSVTNIGDYAFCYCYSLKNLIIPDSVTQIGKWAFLQCESLECIDIPNSVTSIGEYSFNSCYNLKSVTIGNSVTRIDKYAFGSCNNLENVVIGNSVARIGISVFYDCNSMTSMEIPNSVTSIGGYAFQNSGLTEIKFEGDTPSFGSNVFNYVTATAYYPAGNETWTEEVMQDYGGDITWVAYEIAPAVIASGTCGTNLTWTLDDKGKLTVSGEGFATWSGNAPWYDYRDSVKTVVLGNGVTGIVSNAFSRYGNLKCVQLSDTVDYIGPYAFAWCENLTDVTMGSAVTEIGEAAFRNCGSLTYITIPATVRSIGMNAFAYCEKLSGITVDEANTYYSSDENGVLFNEAKTRLLNCPGALTGTYTIPDSVTEIATCAFSACVNLTGVEIPDSVRVIESYAFDGCTGLTEIAIPASVTTLGTKIFDHCAGLQKIRFEGNAPKHFAGDKVVDLFGNTTATVYYPADDATWTEAVRQNYGGTISWKPYCVGEHTEVIDEGVEATCTTDGKTEGKHCSACGEVLVAQEVIPAGHTEVIDEGVDATCTTDGKTEGKHCSACGEVLVKQEVIPAGHTYVEDVCSACALPYGLTYRIEDGAVTITYSPGTAANLVIPATIEGKPVTTIGAGAFDSCRHLKSVIIPDSVTTIMQSAFEYCTGLESIVIPDSVKTIKYFSFMFCTNLKTITIGKGVTLIEGSAFAMCEALTDVYITDANAWCRLNSESIDNLMQWAETLHILGADGNELTDIILDNGVTAIPDKCFRNAKNLTSVTIGDGVTSIGSSAFYGCSKLTSVELSDSLTSIGYYAFYDCDSLTSIDLPASINKIGEDAFPSLQDIYITDPSAWCRIDFGQGDLGNPLWESCALHILDEQGNEVTDVQLDSSVTEIPAVAFANSNLTSIMIPDTVTRIGNYAFYYSEKLMHANLGAGVAGIGEGAFMYCSRLMEITLPEGITTIDYRAFTNCTRLSEIAIPDSVTTLGDETFYNCDGLTKVSLGSGVAMLGEELFAYCDRLTEITIPEGVTAIGAMAFYDCTSLGKVVISNTVTDIGEYAFASCNSLLAITIPDSVKTLGSRAFYSCDNLTDVTLGSGLTEISDAAFTECCNLTSIAIPDNVTIIGRNAFAYCYSLANIVLPTAVKDIGEGAFYKCSRLWHILYKGTQSQWDQIYIGYNNEALANATYHYGARGDEITAINRDLCTERAYLRCGICGAGHSQTYERAVHLWGQWETIREATCTTDGEMKRTCQRVGCNAEDGKWIEAHNHDDMLMKGIEATCTESGMTDGRYCLICGKVTAPQEVIPAKGHSVVEVPAVEPTINAEGNIAHFRCEVCEKLFADAEGVTELKPEDVVLDKLPNGASINGNYYGTVEEALAAAKPGDVVKLMADAAVDMAIVNEGVTLDLNGYTLTADYFVAFNGANVEDNSDDNTGLLKVPANRVMISKSNAQLPVWNGEGYVFSKVTYRKALVAQNEDMVKFAFMPQFQSVATELLKDGFEGNKVTVEVRVSWETIQGREYRNLVFNNDQVALGISSGGAFILTFSGFSQLNLTTDVAIEAVVYSETGVSVVSEAIVVNVTGE